MNPVYTKVADKDGFWMQRAFALAEQAQSLGEVPVGALVIIDEVCVGQGYNQPISTHDPTAHAEIQAIREAALTIGNYRMPQATLVVTLEPCLMCVGAMLHARIQRLVYAASDSKIGLFSKAQLHTLLPECNHQIEVVSGVMAKPASLMLQNFFQQRRA